MQKNDSNELSDLERRLSAHQPSSEGLNTDAMLFAAGQAAARKHPGRFIWPGLTGLTSVAAVIFGLLLTQERAERMLLAQRLQEQTPMPMPTPASSAPASIVPAQIPAVAQLSPDSLRVARRALDRGLDDWPMVPEPKSLLSHFSSAEPVVFSVGLRDKLLDQ